ncbi:hypothetical protein Tco_0213656 [Tanacetum coccineum]
MRTLSPWNMWERLSLHSSVEDLSKTLVSPKCIPDQNVVDVPLCTIPPLKFSQMKHSEIVVNFQRLIILSSRMSILLHGEVIEYVDASPPDVEIVSLEVVEIVNPEVRRIDEDILLTIKDDILREKLLNVNVLIAKIDSI